MVSAEKWHRRDAPSQPRSLTRCPARFGPARSRRFRRHHLTLTRTWSSPCSSAFFLSSLLRSRCVGRSHCCAPRVAHGPATLGTTLLFPLPYAASTLASVFRIHRRPWLRRVPPALSTCASRATKKPSPSRLTPSSASSARLSSGRRRSKCKNTPSRPLGRCKLRRASASLLFGGDSFDPSFSQSRFPSSGPSPLARTCLPDTPTLACQSRPPFFNSSWSVLRARRASGGVHGALLVACTARFCV